MKRRWWVASVVILILSAAGGGYWVYQKRAAANQQAAAAAQQQAAQAQQENVIWASGKLEPVAWAALSPGASGIVTQIKVGEGDQVAKGALLVELDNGVLRSQVAIATAAVAEAAAAMAKLQAGATPAQLAAAAAAVTAAKANVAVAAGQMIEVKAAIDTAVAQLNIAQQQYRELASHPSAAEQTAAKAELAIAEATVRQAQAAYNVVRGDPQIGSRPESMKLQEATAALEAAKAQYTLTTQGATPQQLAVAASNVKAAQVQVRAAQGKAPSAEAAVNAALANQASAQAALDQLHTGATKEELAIAAAHMQSARATLASAQASLRQSQLFAPFTGQVGAINVHVGEQATPGQALLLLGNTQQMQVTTTDLRETDVVHLAMDLPVEVTFDALPGRTFQGKITQIAPVSTTDKGSTNYTVHLAVLDLDHSLRWGMTAFVNIQPTPKVTQAR